MPHSTALHGRLNGQPYLVGPLARINLNLDRLDTRVRAALEQHGHCLSEPQHVPQHRRPRRGDPTGPARGGGHAGRYTRRRRPLWRRARGGHGLRRERGPAGPACGTVTSSTPRGSSLRPHRPADQPEPAADRGGSASVTDRSSAWIGTRTPCAHTGETVIRNYDPCISCATHFLRLNLKR